MRGAAKLDPAMVSYVCKEPAIIPFHVDWRFIGVLIKIDKIHAGFFMCHIRHVCHALFAALIGRIQNPDGAWLQIVTCAMGL